MKYALISQRQMIEIESAFETKRLFATVKDIEVIDKALKILHLLKFSDAVGIIGAELAKPEQSSYSDIVSDGGLDPRNKLAKPVQSEYDKLTVKFGERAKAYLEAAKKSWEPEQEPKLTDAGAETNISRGLEPKGSGVVTMNQVGMRVDLKDAPPRKEWVGLTGQEINHIFAANVGYPERMCRAIEAALREKNNAV
jgi:hypothetical protein